MFVSNLHSIKQIEKQYNTGESPVLVVCSDKESYICKYMRSTSAAYKLVSEYIGACMIFDRRKINSTYKSHLG